MKNTKLKMTVPKARRILKIKSDYKLAQHFDVSRQAVSMWRKRGFIGYAYAAQVMEAMQ